MKGLKRLAELAKKHHHDIPIIRSETRYIGIVLSTISWSLFAVFTVLIEKLNPSFYSHISTKSLTKTFFEFSLIHFSMFCIFLACCLKTGGVKYLIPKEPRLIKWRSIAAVLSFWFYTLARIWTSTIDNSLLYSTDAAWVLLFLLCLKQKIFKFSWVGIAISSLGIGVVFFSDARSLYSLWGWFMGSGSAITLAIITVITAYLVKQDPPIRIGLYQSALGCIASLIVALGLGFFHGFDVPTLHEITVALMTGIIFSVLLYFIWKSFYYTEPYVLGALSYILPVFLILAGWLMGEEPMNKATIVGTSVITVGAFMTVLDSLNNHMKKISVLIRRSRLKNRHKN
jgi:drug/metabolite transporter (DMT)-like permease